MSDRVAGALPHAMAGEDRRKEIFRDDRDRSKFFSYLAAAVLGSCRIATLFRKPSNNAVAQTIRRTKVKDARNLALLKDQPSHD
ncbi:MAG: hypothetical protein JO334_08075 [Verrucomicrobia bacterium]|nr:hypothetical protein [Verrucomicrobiota bacterium]